MKPFMSQPEENDIERIIAYCCGNPGEDELPQIGSVEDMALDLYHDATAMPRDEAAAYLHHQIDDEEIYH